MSQLSNKYPLTERTAAFAESIIEYCRNLKRDVISTPLISQLLRAGTSIGANYAEANNASSKKDFANKIYICKKEAQETKYWLRMHGKYFPANVVTKTLEQECQELIMIFQKIISSLKTK